MPASDTEVLRFETSMHQILKLHVAMAQGMLHGELAIAAGLFGGKRADIVYKLATVRGTSRKKDCIPPKQTPQSYSSKPLTTPVDLQQPCTHMS